jgi:hypothetical protein
VQYPRGDSGAGSPSGGNSPSGGARRALPSASSNDDLDQAKKMIKKREDAQSPIYKIGNAADKMFGGGKETASGVKDTYSRLAKDPKAAAEFKKIQQQRNKDMGIN